MNYFLPNGEQLTIGEPFTIDGYQYPGNWMLLASEEEINAAGITVEEVIETEVPVVPPVVPTEISPRQIRMALTRSNLREQVETAVAAGDQDLKDWWEFSTKFERNNIQVLIMATALGLTEEQVDELWLLGSTL